MKKIIVLIASLTLFLIAFDVSFAATAKNKPLVKNLCESAKSMAALLNQKNGISNVNYLCKGLDELSFQVIGWNETKIPFRSGLMHMDSKNGVTLSDRQYSNVKKYRALRIIPIPRTQYGKMVVNAMSNGWRPPIDHVNQAEWLNESVIDYDTNVQYVPRTLGQSVSTLKEFKNRHPGQLIIPSNANVSGELFRGIAPYTSKQSIIQKWGQPSEVSKITGGAVANHYLLPDLLVTFWYSSITDTIPSEISIIERKSTGYATQASIEVENQTSAILNGIYNWTALSNRIQINGSSIELTGLNSERKCFFKLLLPFSGLSGSRCKTPVQDNTQKIAFTFFNNSISASKDLLAVSSWIDQHPEDLFVNRDLLAVMEEKRYLNRNINYSIGNGSSNQIAIVSKSAFSNAINDTIVGTSIANANNPITPAPVILYHSDQASIQGARYVTADQLLLRTEQQVMTLNVSTSLENQLNGKLQPGAVPLFELKKGLIGDIVLTDTNMLRVSRTLEDQSSSIFHFPFGSSSSTFTLGMSTVAPMTEDEKEMLVTTEFKGIQPLTGELVITTDCHVNDVFLKYHPDDPNAKQCLDATTKNYAYLRLGLEEAKKIPQFATAEDFKASNASLRKNDIVTMIKLDVTNDWIDTMSAQNGKLVTLLIVNPVYNIFEGFTDRVKLFESQVNATVK